MAYDVLEPQLEQVREEYVLVQAWKKTSSFIRYHNWFSDTLALDRAAVNLPYFLAELDEQLKAPADWINDPLRIVPAPKTQKWRVTLEDKRWEPVDETQVATQLRPLAHVSLRDQVVATALMLCLADRVESLQGDPRGDIMDFGVRNQVSSYGNRLFCDALDGELRHRWGSGKLYRAYYQDYRNFLARPEVAAEAVTPRKGTHVVIVHSDLRHFYDRVSPELLNKKLTSIAHPGDDPNFYLLATRVLSWVWDKKDSRAVAAYAQQAGLVDYSKVALPQGLVAAGFFANVVLLEFDQTVRDLIAQEIAPGVYLEDFSRYVDDFRFVLTSDRSQSLLEIEELITRWLSEMLDRHAVGLEPSDEKTIASAFRGDERPLVRQSRKMGRVQSAVSGGFDAIGGQEILDAVQGLIRSQEHYSEGHKDARTWSVAPIPDVRDATVARFAAGRFRSTFRSLRPLLPHPDFDLGNEENDKISTRTPRLARSQVELDDEARAFALGLIQNWIEDPSNVRLLRIGLDLWPAEDTLRRVLELLRPFTEMDAAPEASRRVAWYCLSEIFRAGATETGLVKDNESLPADVDIAAYRAILREEALHVVSRSASFLPWYLRQQALLFLAVSTAPHTPLIDKIRKSETSDHVQLIRFLAGESVAMKSSEFATLAILARRSFRGQRRALELALKSITSSRLKEIAGRDPSFAIEILIVRPDLEGTLPARLREDLSLGSIRLSNGWDSLSEVVLQGGPTGPLRNEITLLSFAGRFLSAWREDTKLDAISPANVLLKLSGGSPVQVVSQLKIKQSRVAPLHSMYRVPIWCDPEERWRLQLGYLLRFILAGTHDFTRVVGTPYVESDEATYRAPENHWYQRLYGLFNGHSAFGDDWLPISVWTERLLFALMRWPGCRASPVPEVEQGIGSTIRLIEDYLLELSKIQGHSGRLMLLPLIARRPGWSSERRPLRACIMQTAIPTPDDFKPEDLTLSDPVIRQKHRNHLSAALAAIERMLDLRETHKGRDGRLDWLILPELSVHPKDVMTHLVPFARAYKTIILAGLTYQDLFAGAPLVNSALWVIPVWSSSHGLQVITRRQGKRYLAPDEEKLNSPLPLLQGFRPCQWLVGYDWSDDIQDLPLWLTASICYDATDLLLAADLRGRSDVFAIPALNRDVNTFDQMALALHYHMFQMVIVANNGLYGGSNAYCPYKEAYVRQVFHLHGQPQASMAFLEIDDIAAFRRRQLDAMNSLPYANGIDWKFPPAGL
jgi:hypothetical protein